MLILENSKNTGLLKYHLWYFDIPVLYETDSAYCRYTYLCEYISIDRETLHTIYHSVSPLTRTV